MGISSALDVSWVVYVVYDPQFSTELIVHWRTSFIHEQNLSAKGAPHWIKGNAATFHGNSLVFVLYIPVYKYENQVGQACQQ